MHPNSIIIEHSASNFDFYALQNRFAQAKIVYICPKQTTKPIYVWQTITAGRISLKQDDLYQSLFKEEVEHVMNWHDSSHHVIIHFVYTGVLSKLLFDKLPPRTENTLLLGKNPPHPSLKVNINNYQMAATFPQLGLSAPGVRSTQRERRAWREANMQRDLVSMFKKSKDGVD